ncbi:MAG: SDR family oxidoreductase [Desulfobacterales bacterium]|jgi:UDP-glucose 4-epimerase
MTAPIRHALVTGGAGFIGSHLTNALIRQGAHVSVIDNLSTGKEANLADAGPDVDLVVGDIRDQALVRRLVQDVDVVFHQAAIVSVPLSVEQPLESDAVNAAGTLGVLDAAREAGCRRVVLASSSAVYGDDPELPKRESSPFQPLSPYAVQKMTGEYYAGLYSRLFGLETACLRYFNVFGPRQDPSSPYSGVISIFMDRAASGRAPVIYGDGEQTRDFVFVQDVVSANLRAATKAGAVGKAFNIGTGSAITINRLWQQVAKLGGIEMPPEYREPRDGDIRHSVAAIDQAREDLGFHPATPFKEGLAKTYAWHLND